MTLAVLYNSVFNMFEVQKHPYGKKHYKKREKENSNIAVLSYQTPVI